MEAKVLVWQSQARPFVISRFPSAPIDARKWSQTFTAPTGHGYGRQLRDLKATRHGFLGPLALRAPLSDSLPKTIRWGPLTDLAYGAFGESGGGGKAPNREGTLPVGQIPAFRLRFRQKPSSIELENRLVPPPKLAAVGCVDVLPTTRRSIYLLREYSLHLNTQPPQGVSLRRSVGEKPFPA